MAYVNQEKKAIIAAAVKAVVPKGWKYTLSVKHHSTIVFTLKSAPVALMSEYKRVREALAKKTMRDLYPIERSSFDTNVYYLEHFFDNSLATFQKIKDALNTGNHDNSEPQSDYYDIGHYISIKVGTYEKDFVCTA